MPRSDRRAGRLKLLASPARPQARATAIPPHDRRLQVLDIALFYGERSGGIRTYLEAKAAFARRTGLFGHHLVIPGQPLRAAPDANRHEQPSVLIAASNGYRIPLGSSGLQATLRSLAPDVVLLHDPFWTPRVSCRCAHELGALVIAVHHSSVALHAAGLPGPQEIYKTALRRWYRRAYRDVDAVMSVVDPGPDTHRPCTLPLRLGIDPCFHPRPAVARQDHVLYVGRLSREKGVLELLEAAAASPEPWPLQLIGTGPAESMLRERAEDLGLSGRVSFRTYVSDREQLATEYAKARCVVLPGAHETFGLVALEAAACGAAVITASSTPSAALMDEGVETFTADDPEDLLGAIQKARRQIPSTQAAAVLAERHSWSSVLAQEFSDVQELLVARQPLRSEARSAG